LVVIIAVILSASDLRSTETEGETWAVIPEMNRETIQGVVDAASDGDIILFRAGVYDWTGTPLAGRADNIGAINVVEKSLTIRGEPGAYIIGPPSVDNPGPNPRGVNAFYVEDLNQDNDVTFQGLTLESFLRGVSCWHTGATVPMDLSLPNLRNLSVLDCTFLDIHRDGITIGEIGGNVLVQNNVLNAARSGLYISWYFSAGNSAWQPEDTFIRILQNTISAMTGLIAYQTTNVIVQDNTFWTTTAGMTLVDSQGGAVISGNSIGNRYQNCIQGIYLGGRTEGAVVEKNTLENLTRYGIMLLGANITGNVIRGNKIRMLSGSYAGLYSFGHNDYLGQNKIMGAGWYAVCLLANTVGAIAHHETLQANNVDQFSPRNSHFYLSWLTHDNLIVGSGMEINTVFDFGSDNRITGITQLFGGIGGELSDAVGMRNEELKEARDVKH
jgi:hypothetical protein